MLKTIISPVILEEPDVVVWHKISREIEDDLRASLGCDTLNYLYEDWESDGEVIWLGDVGLLEAIRLAAENTDSFDLGVTSEKSQNDVVGLDDIEEDIEREVWGPEGIPQLDPDEYFIKQEDGTYLLSLPDDFHKKAYEAHRRALELINVDWFMDIQRGDLMAGDYLLQWLWDDIFRVIEKALEENAKDKRFQWLKKRPVRHEEFLDRWFDGDLTRKTYIEDEMATLNKRFVEE